MLRVILNKSRKQQRTRLQLTAAYLPSHKLYKSDERRHCWWGKDILISNVLILTYQYCPSSKGWSLNALQRSSQCILQPQSTRQSIIVGYLLPKQALCNYLTHILGEKWVHTFSKHISLKVNVRARLEFELTYYHFAAQHVSHKAHCDFPAEMRGVTVIVFLNRRVDPNSNSGRSS